MTTSYDLRFTRLTFFFFEFLSFLQNDVIFICLPCPSSLCYFLFGPFTNFILTYRWRETSDKDDQKSSSHGSELIKMFRDEGKKIFFSEVSILITLMGKC